jgi:methionyl aminopeptidase
LLKTTRVSLEKGIEQAIVGNRIGDISKAIQDHVEENGFFIVRQFVGHGIGTELHEAPEIPNFYQGERTAKLMSGMVLAIEPMVNMGTQKVTVLRDGWTVITNDKQPSAHFEHSIAVTQNGPLILSSLEK